MDKASLPVQRQELINYAKYALGIENYEVFEDAGYSAKNTDRPDFQRMMARMRTGEFSHLMVWKIDRISRNLLDFAAMYAELKELGVTFVSKNEQFDTSNAMGEAMLKIILVFAELERNMTSERVSAVMLSRATDGIWNGGKIPYGYDYDKDSRTFTVREDEANIIRSIYSLYEETHSLLAVSKTLNGNGHRARSGIAWSPVTVRKMLVNPFYVGTYRYNYHDESNPKAFKAKPEDEWVMIEDHHTAIISKAQQDRVMEILERQRRGQWTQDTRYGKNVHIFAGLLTCGCCGSNMTATQDRERADGTRHSMYICSRRRRFKDCENKYVTDLTLGPFVLNLLANLIKASKSFGKTTSIETFQKKLLRGPEMAEVDYIGEQGLREFYNHLKSGFESSPFEPERITREEYNTELPERDILLTEKRRIERALNRLQSAYLYSDDAMPEKDYVLKRKELTDKLAEIDGRISEIDERLSPVTSMTDEEFMAKASYFILSQELQNKRQLDYVSFISKADPSIVKEFIKNVTTNFCIKNGQIVSIRFKNGIELQFFYKPVQDAKTPGSP